MISSLQCDFRAGDDQVAFELAQDDFGTGDHEEPTAYGGLIGVSPVMRRLFVLLGRLEASLAPVLIEGESGTGKELVARALHENSRVKSGPFIAINCGALDRALVRSELFGHKKGSFTGAIASRIGAFEAADGGTVFLDEIGELPLEAQPVLLRALEAGTIVRMGENVERKVDVRVIAATNRGLKTALESGAFRADLYYRLAVVELVIPPLRDRPDDVEVLARHFGQQLGLDRLPALLLEDLQGRAFPGNVRELRNALQAFAALGAMTTSNVERDQVEAALRRTLDVSKSYAKQKQAFCELFQRVYVDLLLARTNGNQSEAARLSGIERTYLNRILSKFRDDVGV